MRRAPGQPMSYIGAADTVRIVAFLVELCQSGGRQYGLSVASVHRYVPSPGEQMQGGVGAARVRPDSSLHQEHHGNCASPAGGVVQAHGPSQVVLRPPLPGRDSADVCYRPHGNCPVVADTMLLTSELAASAVQHTRSNLPGAGFGVLIEHEHGCIVRVTVHDDGSYFDAPYVAQPEPDAEHGRGLFLVDALASSWGSCATLSGRKIWFALEKEF